MPEPFLSLIIPAFNEERRLPDSLRQIADFVDAQSFHSEVLVIENGSTDRTYQVAEAFCAQRSNFHPHHLAERGKGLAVRYGMLKATGDYRMMLDADLSMPVDEIPRFLPPQLENVDVAIASREAPGARRIEEPAYRHWGGRFVNLMIRGLALPGLMDTQCGFKRFRGEVAEDLFSVQRLGGWSFDVEVLYIARMRGYSIVELPIPWYFRTQSHVSPLRDTLRMFTELFAIRNNARKGLYGPAH